MRLSTSQQLPAHSAMRAQLTAIAWGIAAPAAFSALDRDAENTIALLPTHARIVTDTKTGSRLVDVYLAWSDGTVVALPTGSSRTVTWTIVEHGARITGDTVITATVGGEITVDGGYPEHAQPPVVHNALGARGHDRALNRLTKQSTNAEWELLHDLERYVLFSLERANSRVARELDGDVEVPQHSDFFADAVVDRITLDRLSGSLLFGTVGHADTTSVMRRLILRCATTPINQQPLASYLGTNIFSACEEAVRREIGDPHIGRKIRRLHRATGSTSVAELVAQYNAQNPTSEDIGPKRVIAALSAGRAVEANSTSLDGTGANNSGSGFQDRVISRASYLAYTNEVSE